MSNRGEGWGGGGREREGKRGREKKKKIFAVGGFAVLTVTDVFVICSHAFFSLSLFFFVSRVFCVLSQFLLIPLVRGFFLLLIFIYLLLLLLFQK